MFKEDVLAVVKSIPYGKVASYGQVALAAGFPRGARQVGWILNKLDEGSSVPWWRVINKSGRISIKASRFSALDQADRLRMEGITVDEKLQVDLKKYGLA